jgi:hypothetical protein
MTYRNVASEDRGELSLSYVNDGVVLDVSVLANPYVIAVSAQHTVKPNARVGANVNVTDYMRACRDEGGAVYLWTYTFVRDDHGVIRYS